MNARARVGYLGIAVAAIGLSCTSAGAPDGTTTVRSAVGSTVVVTVTDGAGALQSGIGVYALKNNGSVYASATTNASGQATFTQMAANSYRFDVEEAGSDFYSGAVGHCVTPTCTTASITITRVDVTVVDTSGTPQVNQVVLWESSSTTGGFLPTGANGHVSIATPVGSYRFVATQNDFDFYSGAAGHCTVPTCTAVTITTTIPVTVTVRDTSNVPQPNLFVEWLTTTGDGGGWNQTNASGVAVLSVPQASMRFKVSIGSEGYYSGAAGHCTVPGCTSASITVPAPVVVTVVDTGGTPLSGKSVMWQDASSTTGGNANTNASGQATILPPVGTAVRFKVVVDGTDFYSSATYNCSQPGCTSATILVSQQSVVTLVDGSGNPISGRAVTPTSTEGVTSANKTTNASGQATFRLPFAHWQFKAKCSGTNETFYSGDAGHCYIPGGCLTAKIKMPCGQCTTAANGTACDDQNPCTGSSTCQSHFCTGASPMSCSGDQCHDGGACGAETGTCSGPAKANGTSCNDGSACTTGETCQSGTCTGGSAVTCTASDQCHNAGTCNPATGVCSNPAKTDGTSCDDSDACTGTSSCQSGACAGGNPVVCTASDQCHVAGTCNPATGACSNPAKSNGASCNDGNACTQTDTCQSGACTGGNSVTCTASDQCHNAGACNPATGACSNPAKSDGTSCNDGNACTQTDTCQSGTCTGGNSITCTASDQCHNVGTCNTTTGACSNPAKTDGTSCNDGNACTQTDTCQSGTCTGGNAVTCTASDQCHVAGACNTATGVCSNPTIADGSSCNDGNNCTGPDTCQSGSCTSGANTCAAIAVTETVGQYQPHPKLATTFVVNEPEFVPGDVMTFTAVVTNTGVRLDMSGTIDIANTGGAAFVVAGIQQTVEYQEAATGNWVPFARAAYDADGNIIPESTLVPLPFNTYTSGGSDATYPTVPVGSNWLTGTSIAAGGHGHWGWEVLAFVPQDIVKIVLDPEKTSAVRAVVHVDMTSGPGQSGMAALSNPGETGTANDLTVKTWVAGVNINQPVDLASTTTGPLTPGESREFTATITAPIPGSTERGAEEDEGMYRSRMGATHFSRYGFSPVITAEGDTSFVIPDPVYPPSCAMLFPFVLPTKSGPSTIVAGFAGTYSVGLPNLGDSDASVFTIADSVDGSPVTIGNVSSPSSVAPSATGNASFTTEVPVARPVGSMTDVVDVTWKDHNGNVYGPLSASFTGATTVGHPEGYLSMTAAAADIAMVGQPTSFTATALDPHGNPAVGVPVRFAVTGTNPQGPDIVTGSDGKATFSYTSPTIGNDGVLASATITTTPVTAGPINVAWASAVGTPCAGRATPLDIMFVIDVSGSMVTARDGGPSAGKLEAAQAAAERFMDDLNATRDQVGVVVFRKGVDQFAPLTFDSANVKPPLEAGIGNGIACAGNFCDPTRAGSRLDVGLNAALDELASARHRAEATKVVVYIGDGGDDDPATTAAAIARLQASGAKAVTLAIGSAIGPAARQVPSNPNDYFYTPSAVGVDFAFNNLNQDICRNLAPFVSAGGDQGAYNVRMPSKLTLQGEVHDDGASGDRRLTSEWTVISGPGAVAFDDATSPVTDALFFEPGTYVLQLAATDGYLNVADRATITVDPDPSIVGANIAIALSAPGPLETGQAETLTATLTDGLGAPIRDFAVKVTITGANPTGTTADTTSTVLTNLNGIATFTYRGAHAGTDVLHATALGSTFQLDSSNVSVQWYESPTGGPFLTQGWIASPLHNAKLMERVPIVLSQDVTLASGTISYAPVAHQDQVRTLASNVSGAPGATLATLDTTLLANDTYILQLDGADQAGNHKTSVVYVDVTGDYKPGRLVVEVTDLTVPIAGLPITIGRRYDSLEKDKVGDFGYGWSLTVGHPRLEVAPHATSVTLNLPNGRRATFGMSLAMTPEQIVAGFLNPFPGVYRVSYDAEPGVYGKLTQEGGCPFVRYNPDSDVPFPCFFNFPVEGYVPEGFVYTDPYGTAYRMGTDGTMKSITDRQGNSLTFTANGIVSSNGPSVTFVRDAQGRITGVAYPAFFGDFHNAADYTYDANGDLTTVARMGEGPPPLQHTYDQHRLLTTVDSRGKHVRTSTYDADGRLATDTDAMGKETHYAYDLATRTNTTTNPDTGVVTQVFDPRGLVVSETDPRGNTTTHEYDANRNETKRTNALAEVTTSTYDARGNQTSVTDPTGTTHTTYNDDNLPVTFTDRLGHVTTIDYDDRGVPARFADELGTRFKFTNSEQGLPVTVEDAAGNRAYITYDTAGNVTSRTDWLGRVTSTTYDALGNPLTETTARAAKTIHEYSPIGKLRLTRDAVGLEREFDLDPNNNIIGDGRRGPGAVGRKTNYDYDAMNRVKTVRRFINGPVEAVTTDYERDFRGNPLTMTDELGRVTSYEYDKAGNLTKTTFPDGTFTTKTYDALNRLASATDERGNTTTYEYDAGCGCSDRVTVVTDPLGHATTTAYDANGRRTSVTDANGHATTFVYDVRGHVIETHYADGTSTSEEYDARGRRTSMTDQMGATTRYGYDDQGQLTSVTDPLSNVTAYAYDLDGNLTSVTDANGHTTTYDYDLGNRKTARTLPSGPPSETFTYNVFGEVTEHKDFRGKTTTMTYDISGQLLTKVPDPTLGEPSHSYVYTVNGKRLSTTDGSGTTTYDYTTDLRGRLTSKQTAAAGTLTYTYDAAGNVATIRSSNANGTSVDYAWDEANQLVSVTDNRVGGTTTAVYTPTKRPQAVAQPNGVGLTYSYDALDRVTSMLWRHGTSAPFGTWEYAHNTRGQRLSSTDITGRVATYGYDEASRLTSETIGGDPRGATFSGAISYLLDGAGNRLSRTSTLAALTAQSFTYNENDEIGGDTFDANLNTTVSGGHTFAYDFENRLVSKDSGAVTITYDCDGNRVAKSVAGVTIRYLVDDLNPTGYLQVLEEIVGGAVQTRYTYGRNLVSQTRNVSSTPETSYYGYDAHGNISFLTNVSGTVTDSYDYDAWGSLIASVGATQNTRRYAGEELDPDLGLINLRARQYNPNTGRFLTVDPAMGDALSPLSFNRYLFAVDDPVTYWDPTGMMYDYVALQQIGKAVVALTGAAILAMAAKIIIVDFPKYRSKPGKATHSDCEENLKTCRRFAGNSEIRKAACLLEYWMCYGSV